MKKCLWVEVRLALVTGHKNKYSEARLTLCPFNQTVVGLVTSTAPNSGQLCSTRSEFPAVEQTLDLVPTLLVIHNSHATIASSYQAGHCNFQCSQLGKTIECFSSLSIFRVLSGPEKASYQAVFPVLEHTSACLETLTSGFSSPQWL